MVNTFNFDLNQRALRMIEAAKAGRAPTVMASPPTITMKTTSGSAISGGVNVLYETEPALFNVLNSYPRSHAINSDPWSGGANKIAYYCGAVRRAGSAYGGGSIKWQFGYGGRYLDLLLFNVGAGGTETQGYRIWIDGQPTAVTPRTDVPLYGAGRAQIDFGTAKPRKIMVECDRSVEFAGVTKEKDYDIWFTPQDGPTIIGIGDSFTDGGSNSNPQMQNVFSEATWLLGAGNSWQLGESGAGYAQNGNQSGMMPYAKVDVDVYPSAMDWAIICLGINDDDKADADITANAILLYTALWVKDPQLPITVIGPFRAPSLNPASSKFAAVKAAVESLPQFATKQVYYADTLAQNWQQNAGRVGATSGTGNSNVYIGADSIHPVQAGYDYLGGRIANAALAHAQALIAT